MSRNAIKKIMWVVIILLIIIGGVLFLYGYLSSRSNEGTTIVDNIVNIFPGTGNVDVIEPDPNLGDEGNGEPDLVGGLPLGEDEFSDRLQQISTTPVSGGYYEGNIIRYIDKGTGNVYEYTINDRQTRKITNTTIPQIYDSYWVSKDIFVARYLDGDDSTIRSFIGTIMNAGENGRVQTEFLPNNVFSVAVNPTDGSIFYAYSGARGIQGVIHDQRSFDLPISELTFFWHTTEDKSDLYAYNNPSNTLSGTLFKISPDGLMTHVLDGVRALSAHSSNGHLYVYQDGLLTEGAVSGKSIDIPAIPEKCVFVADSTYCAHDNSAIFNYPDKWHQGQASFNDLIYNTQTQAGVATVYSFESVGDMDVTDIKTSTDDKSIVFTNKKDGSLWRLEL